MSSRPVLPKINTRLSSSFNKPVADNSTSNYHSGERPNGTSSLADSDHLQPPASNLGGSNHSHQPDSRTSSSPVKRPRPDLPIPPTPTVLPPTPSTPDYRDVDIAESPSGYDSPEEQERHDTTEQDDHVQEVESPAEEADWQVTESPTGNEEDGDVMTFESPVSDGEDHSFDRIPRKDSGHNERDGDEDDDDRQSIHDLMSNLQIDPSHSDPSHASHPTPPTTSSSDPRSRWAKIRNRAVERKDTGSGESNASTACYPETERGKPSRSNTMLLSTVESGDDEDPTKASGESGKVLDHEAIGKTSEDTGQAARGRLDKKSYSTSPSPIKEQRSLPDFSTGNALTSDNSLDSKSTTGSLTGTATSSANGRPIWNELNTSPMQGVLSGESGEEGDGGSMFKGWNKEKPLSSTGSSSRSNKNAQQERPKSKDTSNVASSSSSSRNPQSPPRHKSKPIASSKPNPKPSPNLHLPPDLVADFHPKHARRSSSTHRVLETLDAKHHANEKGQRMVNQYALGPLIGRGAYGNVEKGIDVGTGQEYAIKEFSKSRLKRQQQLSKVGRNRIQKEKKEVEQHHSSDEKEDVRKNNGKGKAKEKELAEDPLGLIRREIAVMKKLDHPNLVLLYEAINVATSDSLYLVLEYVPGGTLMDINVGGPPTKPLSIETARSYFRQLTLGLEYLHSAGVTHRDIKPDNVLLSADRKRVKLCDFGVSEMFTAGDDRMKKSGGSPAFMSPEAAISSHGDLHARPVDIWAMGVTLYCMLRGKLPFEADNPIDLYESIKKDEVDLPDDWDERVKDLIRRMLLKDPQERITIPEIRKHAWLTEDGQDPMPTTEQNLYDIGKQVEEPSEEEVGNAFSTFRASFTVILAIQKMRRLYRKRRGLSTSSTSTSAWSTPTVRSPATEEVPPMGVGSSKLGEERVMTTDSSGHVTSPEEIEEKEGRGQDYFHSGGE